MSFFSGSGLVKYPVDAVFTANRDELSRAIEHVDDLSHVVKERVVRDDNTVELLNFWHATIPIPAAIRAIVTPSMICWTDRAIWTLDDRTSRWTIEAPYFPDRLRCSGSTRFEETARGRATRVTMRGEIEVDASGLGLPDLAERALVRGIEEFVCGMFPVGFRKVLDAVSQHLSDLERPSVR